jgi:hypothetical protein
MEKREEGESGRQRFNTLGRAGATGYHTFKPQVSTHDGGTVIRETLRNLADICVVLGIG